MLCFFHFTFYVFLVGLPGIEPGLSAPKADVLPVYYSPLEVLKKYLILFFKYLLPIPDFKYFSRVFASFSDKQAS